MRKGRPLARPPSTTPPQRVTYDGERYGATRFRFDRKLWWDVVDWCEANGVVFVDDSTILYTIISIRDGDQAALFKLRWLGVTA